MPVTVSQALVLVAAVVRRALPAARPDPDVTAAGDRQPDNAVGRRIDGRGMPGPIAAGFWSLLLSPIRFWTDPYSLSASCAMR